MRDGRAARREMCEIGRRLYARGLVAASEGNLSCRLDDGRVLCTPTLVCKGFLRPGDLCTVGLDGGRAGGTRRATSELKLHLELYRAAPEVRAVVHSHAPHAVAWSLTRTALPAGLLAEVDLFVGPVARVGYETPGTEAFARLIRPHARRATAALLSHHGLVTWGPSLEWAWMRTEIVEAYCRVLLLARGLGPLRPIPRAKRRELAALRARLLDATTAPRTVPARRATTRAGPRAPRR